MLEKNSYLVKYCDLAPLNTRPLYSFTFSLLVTLAYTVCNTTWISKLPCDSMDLVPWQFSI